ncbi:MAG: aminodeoxychorismate lyase [Alcanivoracaceae bacterium]|jgi:4-amino-4-deoxychorismate lyase|nr:aminodeoxychorismate lyase [Alcanivoracaceae bacterium]
MADLTPEHAARSESALISSDDRGLSYGDGLFETMRMVSGRIPLWQRHRQRLAEGAARLDIPLPATQLDQHIAGQCASGGDAVIKVILTRGPGGRGYSVPVEPLPTLLCQRHPLSLPVEARYRDGLELGVCDIRLASQPVLAGIKHLNRLEQVLARRQVDAAGWHEGLLLGACDEPLELTAMNLFARFADQLWTPALTQAGVAGVMRGYVLDTLAPAMGLTVQVSAGTLPKLEQADELFACNSVAGILPVRKLALCCWPVGEITRAMQEQVRKLFTGG